MAGAPKTGLVTRCACGSDDTSASSSPDVWITQDLENIAIHKLTRERWVYLKEKLCIRLDYLDKI